jgi:hypothetical protein
LPRDDADLTKRHRIGACYAALIWLNGDPAPVLSRELPRRAMVQPVPSPAAGGGALK